MNLRDFRDQDILRSDHNIEIAHKDKYYQQVRVPQRKRSCSEHKYQRRGHNNDHMKTSDWFKRYSKLFSDLILNKFSISKQDHRITSKILWDYYFELVKNTLEKKDNDYKRKSKKPVIGFGPWPALWESVEESIRERSPYEKYKSLKIRPMICKGGDDLRQELFAMNLIKIFDNIFKMEKTDVTLKPYDIILNNHESGLLGIDTFISSNDQFL